MFVYIFKLKAIICMGNFLKERFYILIAMYAGVIFISNDAFLPAIPEIASQLNSSVSHIQDAVTTFLLGSLILLFFMGALSDKYGRKRVILVSGVIFLIGNTVCGLVNDATTLLLARIISGSAMSSIGAAGIVAINEYYNEKEAVKSLAYASNVMISAPMLGPIVGAMVLSSTGNWRNIFLYDSVLMVFVLILIYLYMPETNKNIGSSNKLSDQFRGMFYLLKSKVFFRYALTFGFLAVPLMFWITGSSVMLRNNLGEGYNLSANEYALWQLPVFLCLVCGNNLAVFISKKFGVYKTVNYSLWSFVLLIPVFLIFPYYFPHHALGIAIPMGVFLLVRGINNAPFNQFILSLTSTNKGSAGGIAALISSIASVLGSKIASSFSENSNNGNMANMLIFVLFFALIGVLNLIASNIYKNKDSN